ncbi:CobW family GTP-binding protein [Planctobacterium marinum]|uniref:CobW family GTP-binding protein n=1 Tax=Planctobacterium marinum TaxID=1631968 RepID=UPI001E4A0565|nr:GTP-binding protein [Planctobacterium marinum]MCC2607121.1 GTP-binding protein [Planctobacterium marinum]
MYSYNITLLQISQTPRTVTARISSPIPTHLITGFLGVGKTTLIKHLLEHKPRNEKWAILVNEFGEIGIDGQLLSGPQDQQKGIFIKEVPGGCMCCTSGLPMQIALAMLISQSKPDRLFIEPTGLGHPNEVISELQKPHNREVIDLKAVMTMFDARKLVQPRYHDHHIFREQLEIADILVAAKADLYTEQDKVDMLHTLEKLGLQDKPRHFSVQGNLPVALLETRRNSAPANEEAHHHHHADAPATPAWQTQLEQDGCAYTQQTRSGFITEGWIYDKSHIFDFTQIFTLLNGINPERLKGVFITERGIFGFNKTDGILSCIELSESDDSRLEIIYPASSESGTDTDDKASSVWHSALDINKAIRTRLS